MQKRPGKGWGGGGGVGGRKRKRNLGKSTFKEVSKPFYYFEEIKPVKFTRDSNWLARYDFMVIREGYHVDLHIFSSLQSSQVKRTPQNSTNEFIIRKLSPLAVVDFRFISTFLHA